MHSTQHDAEVQSERQCVNVIQGVLSAWQDTALHAQHTVCAAQRTARMTHCEAWLVASALGRLVRPISSSAFTRQHMRVSSCTQNAQSLLPGYFSAVPSLLRISLTHNVQAFNFSKDFPGLWCIGSQCAHQNLRGLPNLTLGTLFPYSHASKLLAMIIRYAYLYSPLCSPHTHTRLELSLSLDPAISYTACGQIYW